uniref:ARAD1D16676p n=1 Tax=Blastobotrys adeninivorans TaxID=409370 RepID=A0A060TER1_BLAAD
MTTTVELQAPVKEGKSRLVALSSAKARHGSPGPLSSRIRHTISLMVPLITSIANGYTNTNLMGVTSPVEEGPVETFLFNNALTFAGILTIGLGPRFSKFDKRIVLSIGCILVVLGSVMMRSDSCQAHPEGLIICRFVIGMGTAIASAVSPALLADFVPKGPSRDAIGPFYMAIWFVGMAVGPIFPSSSLDGLWKAKTLIQALLPALQLGLLIFVYRSPGDMVRSGHISLAEQSLRSLHGRKRSYQRLVNKELAHLQSDHSRQKASSIESGFISRSVSRIVLLAGSIAIPVLATHIVNHICLSPVGNTMTVYFGWGPIEQHVVINISMASFNLVQAIMTTRGALPSGKVQALALSAVWTAPLIIGGVYLSHLESLRAAALGTYIAFHMSLANLAVVYFVLDKLPSELEQLCTGLSTVSMLVTLVVNGLVNADKLGALWPQYLVNVFTIVGLFAGLYYLTTPSKKLRTIA